MERSARATAVGTSCIAAAICIVALARITSAAALGEETNPLAHVTPVFRDATEEVGVRFENTLTWGSTWVDHDRDGDDDLLANRHWHRARFYVNDGRGSYGVSLQDFAGIKTPDRRVFDRHSCAWGEADGDGRPDLFCSSGAQSGKGSGPNQLWINSTDGFSEEAGLYGVQDVYARTRTVSWLDYDRDGDLDIFTGNKKRRGQPNVLFRNDGGGFVRVDAGLSEEMNTLASSWSDWDRDGDPDLLVLRYRPARALAYLNVEGRFTKVSLPDSVARGRWTSAVWGDYDGDGWTDLHLISPRASSILRNVHGTLVETHRMKLTSGSSSSWLDLDNDTDLDAFVVQGRWGPTNEPDLFLIQGPGGTFTRVPAGQAAGGAAGSGESASVADHDLDGDLDLFVTNGAHLFIDGIRNPASWRLYENETEGLGHSTRLTMIGSPRNPWGYGARLTVTTASTVYSREITDGMSLRAQYGVGNLLLGLGQERSAIVRIDWPLGGSDCIRVRSGAERIVRKGTAPCGRAAILPAISVTSGMYRTGRGNVPALEGVSALSCRKERPRS